MPMVYNSDTGEMEFVSDGVYSGPASQGNSIQGNFGDDPNNALRAKGYIPYADWNGSQVDWKNMQGASGQPFNNEMDYLNWLYGAGGSVTDYNGEQFYQTPNGADAYLPGRSPLVNATPDSKLGELTKMGIFGLAGAGLTGMLPGVEGAFGAAGGAAAEAAPALGELGSGAYNLGAGGASGIAETGGVLGSGAAGVPGAASMFPAADALALGAGAAGGLTGPISFGDIAQYGQLGSGTSGGVPTGISQTGGPLGSGTAGVPGGGAASGGSAPWGVNPASGGSALGNILGGKGGAADYLSVGGNLLGAGLGVVGANQQANAYGDIAQQYLDMGKPYRDLLQSSYGSGFNLATADPQFQNALDTSAQTAARSWSARAGNPADSPTAQAEINKYVLGSTYLPQLNTYRGGLMQAGGMGLNTAGSASGNQVQAQGGGWEAIGSGVENIFNPKKSLFDSQAMQGLLSGFKINQPNRL